MFCSRHNSVNQLTILLVSADCESPPTIEHGTVDHRNVTIYNAVVSVRCDSGFRRNGTSALRCEAGGRWSEVGTCVIKGNIY